MAGYLILGALSKSFQIARVVLLEIKYHVHQQHVQFVIRGHKCRTEKKDLH